MIFAWIFYDLLKRGLLGSDAMACLGIAAAGELLLELFLIASVLRAVFAGCGP